MRQKRRPGLGGAAVAKKTKTVDGAVPKVKYDETYQRTSCVRMALGGAVVSSAWVGLFRDVAKRMTTLTWLASRAFNHFLLSAIINGRFEITNRNVLVQVIGLCFKVGSEKISTTDFTEKPLVAAWIEDFRTLNADFPLVSKRGMTNVIQAGINQYVTAVENFLTYGLRDLYVRALKALSVADAEVVALRVLSQSVAKRKKNFSFVLTSDDEYKIKSPKNDPMREAAIVRSVGDEVDLMGTMQTYNDAFRFLNRLRWRLTQDDARRRIANPEARPSRAFSLAPLTSMKPCFIRVDKTALGELWSTHFRTDAVVVAPRCIEDVLSVRARVNPRLNIGDSFQTDGTQLVVPYLAITTKTLFLTPEKREERRAALASRNSKLAAYHEQKARLAIGEMLGASEERILWTSVKPRYKSDTGYGRPLNGSFADATHGFFDRGSAYASAGPLPAIIAIDPGQKNIWCASVIDPSAVDTPGEAKKILNLTRRQYNQQIGLFAFNKWLDKAKKNATKHDFVGAQDALSAHSLKGLSLVNGVRGELRRPTTIIRGAQASLRVARLRQASLRPAAA